MLGNIAESLVLGDVSEDGQSATLRLEFEQRFVINGRYKKQVSQEEWLVRLEDDGPRVGKVVVD